MDKTAFVTRRGQFRFKVLSFGLANAPILFQKKMDLVLAGLTWSTFLVYIDDVICFANSFEEHVERLGQVFARLSAAGLKLKPSKCKLFQRRVAFLGHIVSQDGVEADPSKVAAIASQTLTPAEKVYCTTRKEQLAMVYSLRQFRPYILGHRTVVRSDHAALMYLKRAKEPVGQQARWLDFIEQFTLDLQHRKGASHNNADALSRRPCGRQGNPCRQCSGRSDNKEDSAATR